MDFVVVADGIGVETNYVLFGAQRRTAGNHVLSPWTTFDVTHTSGTTVFISRTNKGLQQEGGGVETHAVDIFILLYRS